MSRPTAQRIQVPDELRDVLLEFTISYLLEQPGDVVEFAVEFFHRMRDNRTVQKIEGAEVPSPDESVISKEEGMYTILFSIIILAKT